MVESPVTKIIKRILPAVVNITSSKYLQAYESPIDFFGPELYTPQAMTSRKKKVKTGGGSGFIVDSKGIILTNRHVIEDPNLEYLVVLQNGEKITPEIIGKDPINDVAILKVHPSTITGLPFIELGDSSFLELGEDVIAVGNALGMFQNTVSTGIVSGLSRSITAQSSVTKQKTKLRGLIQTDAAINPGNSGGPLLNMLGQAIGINAAMVFGAENIGFSLPINNAKRDLFEIMNFGRIREPFLGVRYISIDKEMQEKYKLPIDTGALVVSETQLTQGEGEAVSLGSPAYKAGIQETDIILELGEKKINEELSLNDILQECQVGEQLPVKILRAGKPKILNITLAEKI